MRDRFNNPGLYDMALTHRSWKRTSDDPDYERLEFLGDAVLQLFATELLYRRFPDWTAGDLTKLRQRLVNEGTLARISAGMGLGAEARLGKGEETTGGRDRPALLADLFEAVLGAIYLDQGEGAARQEVERRLAMELEMLAESLAPAVTLEGRLAGEVQSFKNQLQEFTQAPNRRLGTPVYEQLEKLGSDHQPTFKVAVSLAGRVIAEGEGPSLKKAEADAASKALRRLQFEESRQPA